jgi:O-antigen ligase
MLDMLIPGGSNYRKVYSLIYYGSATTRTNLYIDSLITFINNPIYGSNSLMDIGEHSFFIDRMAALGLIGIIPLVTLIILFNRYIYKKLSHTKNYYILCVSLYIMLWLLKNVMNYQMLLYAMTILPGFCIYIETHYHKIKYNG